LIWFRIGWVGMDLFFAISGFVIAYSALVLYRRAPPQFAKSYWLRRITRIVPLYLLTLAAWIAFAAPGFFESANWKWQLFTHLTFIHSFWPDTHGGLDGPNWSLAIEMHFYLAIALLIGWIDRTPGWRIWLYTILIAWAWRGAMFILFAHTDTWVEVVHVDQMPGFLDEFGAGIFLAKMALGERPRVPRAVIWLLAACGTGYVAMATFWPRAGFWEFGVMVTFWHTALSAFLLCVLGVAISAPQLIASSWLRPLNYLGEISYGIYLWHLFAIEYVIRVTGLKGGEALLWIVALTFMLAAASWRYFEKPFMDLARNPPGGHRRDS
jgi:peptidoglycan/LPS O-acetylase OafA/YrhL